MNIAFIFFTTKLLKLKLITNYLVLINNKLLTEMYHLQVDEKEL
jgi:hypothetical protein